MSDSPTARSDPEKNLPDTIEDVDLDRIGEREGYVLDASLGHATTRHLKTTKDGSTILIPQPSEDPNDPLNWSQTKKNIILLVISFTGAWHLILPLEKFVFVFSVNPLPAFLPDYGSATGAVTLLPQAA